MRGHRPSALHFFALLAIGVALISQVRAAETKTFIGWVAALMFPMLRCEAPSLEARTGRGAPRRQGCVLRGDPRVKPGGRTSG